MVRDVHMVNLSWVYLENVQVNGDVDHFNLQSWVSQGMLYVYRHKYENYIIWRYTYIRRPR